MFPGSAALPVMMMVGLGQLVPRRWRAVPASVLSSVLLVYAIVCMLVVIPPLYPALRTAQPAELEKVTPVDVDFGDSLRLIGYQVDRTTVQAGTDLNLNLYWQARGANRPDLFAEVTLVDAENNLISRSRRWPGDNGTSIQVWDLERTYADSRTMRVADAALTGDAQLILTVKAGRDGPTLIASRDGNPLGEQAVLQAVHVQSEY